MFKFQLHDYIARKILHQPPQSCNYADNKEVGKFMKQRVFEPGALLSWNELTKHATGQELNAKAFAAEFKAD